MKVERSDDEIERSGVVAVTDRELEGSLHELATAGVVAAGTDHVHGRGENAGCGDLLQVPGTFGSGERDGLRQHDADRCFFELLHERGSGVGHRGVRARTRVPHETYFPSYRINLGRWLAVETI